MLLSTHLDLQLNLNPNKNQHRVVFPLGYIHFESIIYGWLSNCIVCLSCIFFIYFFWVQMEMVSTET